MKKIAVYPGTFDPITNGHVDIIQRGLKLFDHIILAVAESSRKKPYFDLTTRLTMCQLALDGCENLSVMPLQNLLVDFSRENNVQFILRGLRTTLDFDYEFQLTGMNRFLAPEIETVFLQASEQHAFISATIIREILSVGGDVSAFVSPAIMKFLEK